MPTIKQEVDDAAGECGIASPASWLGGADDARMMQRLIRAISRDLLDRHEWTGASVTDTISPVVETATWVLPANFNRLQPDANAIFEVNPNRRPVMPMTSDGDWVETQAWGSVGAQRYFRKTGNAIEFYRPLPPGATVRIAYVSNNWVTGGKSEWTDEQNDTPIFPSQLLRFGLIYRWRRQKGLRHENEMAEYESILARAIGDDRPSRMMRIDGGFSGGGHPMRVPVPDFIPSGS